MRRRWDQRQAGANDHAALALPRQHHFEQLAVVLGRTGDQTAIARDDIEIGYVIN